MISRGYRKGRYALVESALFHAGEEGLSTSELAGATGLRRDQVRKFVYAVSASRHFRPIASTGQRGRAEGRYWHPDHAPSPVPP